MSDLGIQIVCGREKFVRYQMLGLSKHNSINDETEKRGGWMVKEGNRMRPLLRGKIHRNLPASRDHGIGVGSEVIPTPV